MKCLAIFFGLVGVMVFSPVFGSSETPEEFIYVLQGAQNESCKFNDTCFNPSTLVVSPNTKVTWVAQESGHKISSGIRTQTDVGINTDFDGEFQSNYLNANDTFSHVFTKSGKYSFHSWIFGHASGQVIVTKSNDSPVYSAEKCDLLHDLKIYENLLHNDVVVRTFLSKYPNAVSFVNGIDESSPLKAPIVYEDGTGDKKVFLVVYVREEGVLSTDCFSPVIYTYKYYKDNKPASLQYYYNEKQLMVDFLNNHIIHSPLKQHTFGIPFDEIQCKENLVLIQRHDGSPACVKPESINILVHRGWADGYF
ncbi:MAG: hypothetical protein K5790_01730 [Nitrosopumilus sp.]|uniref:cupredoxin domain-containing protein n=1 Tax=Nitrosopumilus sp. TaxID=2024843 RepID=UPI00247D21D0|nr:hypothetical protein [Nitrosopumilus sp.]MCV0391994.1 hypothetical protein [Nitrosopumilus sp.]